MTEPSLTHDQPLIAIDVVPMSFTTGDGLRVATARRLYDPFAGQEALPGVLLQPTELLVDGARRALRTKTGITRPAVRHLAQIGAFDGPDRDPRSAAISIAFVAVVDVPGVSDVDAVPLGATDGPAGDPSPTWREATGAEPSLPFDHDRIIEAAVDDVRTRLWRDLPLTRALLGPRFTTADASRLQAALYGAAPDPGNLNRALRTNPALERVAEASSIGSRGGRPPAVWTWTD
ncbi:MULTISPECIES: NUDIX domain-containing protein [unclassified Curtobacterium]|uniref:NUDIX domain-containing protein n=1 Tax=unclassified Curtobacterium TaxID=257496 RepID=UPI00226B87ED|nr:MULTISPECIES: NUDIX domain-containing protein [unclassified Curtobacterium]